MSDNDTSSRMCECVCGRRDMGMAPLGVVVVAIMGYLQRVASFKGASALCRFYSYELTECG